MTMHLKSILLGVCLSVSIISSAKCTVDCLGVQMGCQYKDAAKILKNNGFKLYVQQAVNDTLIGYGEYRKYYFTGRYDGCKAVMCLSATKENRIVFDQRLILRGFVDPAEALEEGDRLLSMICDKYKPCKTEQGLKMTPFVEMPSPGKRVTMYLCFTLANVIVRFFADKETYDKDKFYGLVSVSVFQNSIGHECLVIFDFRDEFFDVFAKLEASVAEQMKNKKKK